MSKKDYKQFATMIKQRHDELTNEAAKFPTETCHQECHLVELEGLAKRMADIFAADNPNFSRSRFMVACGLQED